MAIPHDITPDVAVRYIEAHGVEVRTGARHWRLSRLPGQRYSENTCLRNRLERPRRPAQTLAPVQRYTRGFSEWPLETEE